MADQELGLMSELQGLSNMLKAVLVVLVVAVVYFGWAWWGARADAVAAEQAVESMVGSGHGVYDSGSKLRFLGSMSSADRDLDLSPADFERGPMQGEAFLNGRQAPNFHSADIYLASREPDYVSRVAQASQMKEGMSGRGEDELSAVLHS